jgi:hypothetical protein
MRLRSPHLGAGLRQAVSDFDIPPASSDPVLSSLKMQPARRGGIGKILMGYMNAAVALATQGRGGYL